MAKQADTAPTILRRKQLESRLGLSRSTIYDRINPKSERYDPDFPKPIKLGARAIGFIESEVNTYLADLVEKCRQAP